MSDSPQDLHRRGFSQGGGFLLDYDAGVLSLTFNRPGQGNAISAEMVPLLTEVFKTARSDPGVRCIVVRGAGPNLSAGGDVASFARTLAMDRDARADMFTARLDRCAAMVTAVLSFDRPLITVHRGAAAGAGLLFTLAADVVVADDTASFVFAHQKLGLPPDGGVSVLLPSVVGWRAAKRLVLDAARVDAKAALNLGLLDRIHVTEEIDVETRRLAAGFARAPQGALASAKRLFNAPLLATLQEGLNAETEAIAQAVRSEDFEEGVTAFLEKRRAVFPSAA